MSDDIHLSKVDRAALAKLIVKLSSARLSTWCEDDPPVDVCITDSQRVAVVQALRKVLKVTK